MFRLEYTLLAQVIGVMGFLLLLAGMFIACSKRESKGGKMISCLIVFIGVAGMMYLAYDTGRLTAIGKPIDASAVSETSDFEALTSNVNSNLLVLRLISPNLQEDEKRGRIVEAVDGIVMKNDIVRLKDRRPYVDSKLRPVLVSERDLDTSFVY